MANTLDVPIIASMWAKMMTEIELPGFEFNDFALADFFYNQTMRLHNQELAGKHYAFIVVDGNVPVGFVSGGVCAVPGAAQLEQLYVDPDYRNKGIARKLTGAAMRWATMAGMERMQIVAHPDREKFYKRFGFRTQNVLMMGELNSPKLLKLVEEV